MVSVELLRLHKHITGIEVFKEILQGRLRFDNPTPQARIINNLWPASLTPLAQMYIFFAVLLAVGTVDQEMICRHDDVD